MRRPSPSMLVALLALAVALGGTASAAHLITARELAPRSVTARAIAPGAVTRAKLAPALVTANAQGAAGLVGPRGLTGPQGATGGTVRLYQVFSEGTNVAAGASQTLRAECSLAGRYADAPGPDMIVSGGYTVTDVPGVLVAANHPYVHEHPGRDGHGHAWSVSIDNGSGVPVYFSVNGICVGGAS